MPKVYEQYKPTKKQIMFPIIIFAIAVVIGGSLLLIAKGLGGNELCKSFIIPSTKTLMLEETGAYTIYLGTDTVFERKHYSIPKDYKGLKVKASFNQTEVILTPIEEVYEYGEEGNKRINVYNFTVNEGGEYTFECTLEDDTVENAIIFVGKTQEHTGTILGLTTIACMLLIMGICQLIGYLLYNGVQYGIYCYKKNKGI